MVEIIIVERAQEDLVAIAEYWGQFSMRSARIHLDKIYEKIELLRTFPKLGKVFEELSYHNVREIVVGPYRIFYHILTTEKFEYWQSITAPCPLIGRN